MAGLIPDLGSEIKEEKDEALLRFSYDNTLEEIDGAMKTFQEKFSGRKHRILLAAYILLTVAAIVLIIVDHTSFLPYAALLFCIFNLYFNLTDRKRMRKKIIEAIKDTNPEDYSAAVYDDRIEIDTIIKPKEDEIKMDDNGDDDISNIAPVKNIFIFCTDMLDFAENEESLLLIAARRQTYCFPKRCLSKSQEEELRSILSEKTEL
ncbi:MAG: hypothetical protein ACI4KA_10015 [Oscillospiraceae bacterium]